VRGRYPSGPEYVDVQHLHGSAQAKERLRVILETMMGQWRVGEACQRLGISEQRFRQLRAELLEAALERLEPRPAGRPRRVEESEQVASLRRQLEAMQRELHVAQVRAEIALALPQVATTPATAPEPALQKKR